MKKSEADRLWSNEENWRYGCLYNCVEDPRLVVPKRNRKFGWTCNFAHPTSWLVIALFVAIAIGPTFGLIFSGSESVISIAVTLGLSIIAVIAVAKYFEMRGIEG